MIKSEYKESIKTNKRTDQANLSKQTSLRLNQHLQHSLLQPIYGSYLTKAYFILQMVEYPAR